MGRVAGSTGAGSKDKDGNVGSVGVGNGASVKETGAGVESGVLKCV